MKQRKRAIIAGGGWGGCAAAVSAVKCGMDTVLLERTDMLLGTGLVGGIMRNNGRFTAQEECAALGAGELFRITDQFARHRNVDFPGHRHASLYDVTRTPAAVERYLHRIGVRVEYQARIRKAEAARGILYSVTDDSGRVFDGDVFVDATGSAGPQGNCAKYGNGCAMCVLRCPSFGGRVSLTALAGIPEIQGKNAVGETGAMSGSCKLQKESLAPSIVGCLERTGVAVIPLPKELIEDHLAEKACQQYALPEYRENLILLDTGHAKMMTPFFDLHKLRRVPGFENARYADPYAGGRGNSVRFLAMAPREDSLLVNGMKNLLCAGEKAGLLVGHTEAIVTGSLAGFNAARLAYGKEPLCLPRGLACGEAIAFVREQMGSAQGLSMKYTFSGSVLYERLKKLGLDSSDPEQIRVRVNKLGLAHILRPRYGDFPI
ncbi:MAG: FAD-dependent oxidoreductase [Oscillospiraceae bacterium]|nr:FAD-dependent oxidoreductase [Oscillospiraceae bacterium]